jgi:hypothetical protein
MLEKHEGDSKTKVELDRKAKIRPSHATTRRSSRLCGGHKCHFAGLGIATGASLRKTPAHKIGRPANVGRFATRSVFQRMAEVTRKVRLDEFKPSIVLCQQIQNASAE